MVKYLCGFLFLLCSSEVYSQRSLQLGLEIIPFFTFSHFSTGKNPNSNIVTKSPVLLNITGGPVIRINLTNRFSVGTGFQWIASGFKHYVDLTQFMPNYPVTEEDKGRYFFKARREFYQVPIHCQVNFPTINKNINYIFKIGTRINRNLPAVNYISTVTIPGENGDTIIWTRSPYPNATAKSWAASLFLGLGIEKQIFKNKHIINLSIIYNKGFMEVYRMNFDILHKKSLSSAKYNYVIGTNGSFAGISVSFHY